METTDLLSIGEVARRSGFATSALRYYEHEGLISARREPGGRRVYPRNVLRRLAVIRAARSVGLSLDEVRVALSDLPDGRVPTRADWARLSKTWRDRLDEQIRALISLRDSLETCIGCGCLSLTRCRLSNPDDVASGSGPGAAYLPPALRRG